MTQLLYIEVSDVWSCSREALEILELEVSSKILKMEFGVGMELQIPEPLEQNVLLSVWEGRSGFS